jgi:hypothetical protein
VVGGLVEGWEEDWVGDLEAASTENAVRVSTAVTAATYSGQMYSSRLTGGEGGRAERRWAW